MSVDQNVQVFVGLEQQLDASGNVVDPTRFSTEVEIVVETVVLVARYGNARRSAVAQVELERGLAVERAEIAHLQPDEPFRSAAHFRLPADEADEPGRCIAPVERTLRTLQHLHPLDVERSEALCDVGTDEHVVRIYRDRVLVVGHKAVGADAPEERLRGSAAKLRAPGEIGGKGSDVAALFHAQGGELIPVESGDGERYVLQRFVFSPCGHRDFFQQRARSLRICDLRQTGRCGGDRQSRGSRVNRKTGPAQRHRPGRVVFSLKHRSTPTLETGSGCADHQHSSRLEYMTAHLKIGIAAAPGRIVVTFLPSDGDRRAVSCPHVPGRSMLTCSR